jgi:tRNA threonylcarbamoyl adenosine modification protein YeaZ
MSKETFLKKSGKADSESAVLSISQSTALCSTVINRNGRILARRSWDSQMMNNHDLFKALPELFEESELSVSDIELFGVDIGPGSFAGIRTAISAANGMALPDNKQVIGISCGMAIAHDILIDNPDETVIVVGDARRQRLWLAEFIMSDGIASVHKDYSLVTNDEFKQLIRPDSIIATPDWHRLDEFLTESTPKNASLVNRQSVPTADTIAHLTVKQIEIGIQQEASVLPLYMHPPVQEAPRK